MNDQPAPIWRRIAALVYDTLILAAISLAYGALATAAAAVTSDNLTQDYTPMFQGMAFPLGWFLSLSLFYCWFWRKSGQTIGMRTWKIKLIPLTNSEKQEQNQSPEQLSWSQCALRCLVSPPLILLGGIGFISAVIDPQKRSLQDRATRTFVAMQ